MIIVNCCTKATQPDFPEPTREERDRFPKPAQKFATESLAKEFLMILGCRVKIWRKYGLFHLWIDDSFSMGGEIIALDANLS